MEQTNEGSKFCYKSTNVKDSSYTFDCDNVVYSKLIVSSKQVKNSEWVKHSEVVTNSLYVQNSSSVRDSTYVMNSSSIVEASQILRCNDCNMSFALIDCKAARDSKFCYCSEDILDCTCSAFLKNCTHCIFSSGLSNESYMVFNQKVSPNRFSEIREIMDYKFGDLWNLETVNIVSKDGGNLVQKAFYDTMFDALGADFFGWLGSLPEYDENVFIRLFFRRYKS